MPKITNINQLITHMGDPGVPVIHKAQELADILISARDGEEKCQKIADQFFDRVANVAGDENARKKAEMLASILEQLQSAPLRPATFVGMSQLEGSCASHALVSLENGDMAYVVAHDQHLAKSLKMGDRILLDGEGKILMRPSGDDVCTGVEIKFERRIDDRHIEVINHQDEKAVVLAIPEIMEAAKSGKIAVGTPMIAGAGRRMAVRALPPIDNAADNFRFLDRGSVPDVLAERDIGSPPRIIEQVAVHVREEMTRPELRRRFRLRPCITRLLRGVSGTGKTLAIQAIHRKMYDIMSEVTGTPVEQLPHRVFRFRTSQMLSMWLGESDKNIDRLFDEVERVAPIPFPAVGGKEFRMPVLVIIEEIDGIGRARGEEAVYDRILTTILQRLDPNRRGLSDQLIVFLSTTNEPHIVDPALLRRIGGSIETFGRLERDGFVDVLRKHVDGLPASDGEGVSEKKAWAKIIRQITNWMFDDPASDSGVVELSYHGWSKPSIRHHRDFLTGALVDRSVQQAATEAWEASISGNPESGITFQQLASAISSQVASIADQLIPQNVSRYLDIPEGVRVTGVRNLLKKS